MKCPENKDENNAEELLALMVKCNTRNLRPEK